ncbi:hypothetical protein [Pedobacter punctiformis]|uniref:DUF4062 domain-containing protein n=1 Tax=Pedobacter punctiformis TaxID=3004097 RepID=A0ABT4L6S3_9SPHI|nr:hypothetical protein [Pedobacter sp. HCMS5-2]MCZ4243619.1 hypothetical protein [Pedobacter sp. HCMS5-2]
MPEIVKKFKILIASPSDVIDERESIVEIVSELNQTYGNRNNIIIELIKWETHSAPGVSTSDTQSLIDHDLGKDYDLFVGILWKKFGTKTQKYDSGTEQEFRNVYERFLQHPESVQILFYFKMASVPMEDINIDQISKIQSFKNDLGEMGVFYWQYNTIQDFQQFLRIHIPRRIDHLNKLNEKMIEIEPIESYSSNVLENIINDEEELGIFELNEIIEESFNHSSESIKRITAATDWISDEMIKKAKELDKLNAKGDIARKILSDWYERSAKMMVDFSSRLEPEIPIFRSNFEEGANAISNLIILYDQGDGLFDNQKEEVKQSVIGLAKSIESGLDGMESFLQSISKLPRVQKDFNKARRSVEAAVFEIISSMKVNRDLLVEVLKNIQ